MNKRGLARDFYEILRQCNFCPFSVYCRIRDEEYTDEELSYLCRLLHRWVEWQKLERLGGRTYYNYFKIKEECI